MTMRELAIIDSGEPAPQAHAQNALEITFTPEQIQLLKDTYCKGASDDEFALFLSSARRLKLDPFARQICAVFRWDSKLNRMAMTHQTTIDGFRLTAERTGRYAGQVPIQWCGKDSVWREVWVSEEPPAAARAGVLRNGFDAPMYATARYGAYVQTTKDGKPNSMWRKMPDVMLAKCAEALALRKAFPNELSGIYTDDEMGQAANDSWPPPAGTQRIKPSQRPAPVTVVEASTANSDAAVEAEPSELDKVVAAVESAATLAELDERVKTDFVKALRNGERQRVVVAYKARLRELQDQQEPPWDAVEAQVQADRPPVNRDPGVDG